MDLRPFFNIKIVDTVSVERNDNDAVVNLMLTDDQGRNFFLKEIQTHSMREGLDAVYTSLSHLRPKHASLLLPVMREDKNKSYIFKLDEKNFLLFPYKKLKPFSMQKCSLENLWAALEEFHHQLAGNVFPKHNYRNYKSWLHLGSNRLQKKFGDDLPFLNEFNSFLNFRFDLIRFHQGNIHWDIHEDNLSFVEGKLLLLDFDLVQEGALIQDYLAAAAMYIDWQNPDINLFLEKVWMKTHSMANGLKREDLPFLLFRNYLGNLSQLSDRDQVVRKLEQFLTAC